jgi:hypothetical protein
VYVRPTAPRSIGGILDDAIKLYRDAFAKSWPLALLGQMLLAVPVLIVRSKVGAVPAVAGNPLSALAVYASPGVWLTYLVAVILLVGINNALVRRADGVGAAREEPPGQSLAAGFRLLPRTILLFFAIFAAMVITGIIVGLLAAALDSVPVAKGILLAAVIAAGIYAWGRIFLANIALVVDDAAVLKSLEISWTLIKNHWWRSATVYTVAVIIAMVFYFVIAFLSGLIIGVLHGSGLMIMLLSELISVAGGTVLMTFFPAVLVAMYYDLKLRREGADLAGRVNALAPQ